ncbi:MAG: aromatic ring-hydroxylating dioxygenase subunit alpha [Alphaproteobacteria bacterium]|nr:aromatic ring-hydroxylating dioxygenase subunit alpha [Alphaproteobacteria bacterium]MCB9697224.1 aromatic ring-hydroxylating dioxygenase subunit alpha [Alphaproteobacteria bacterium]
MEGGAAALLVPPRVRRGWFVACRSADLRARPIVTRLWGLPITLFRTEGGVGALVDRCPHRNVPLSDGTVVDGTLQCPYHGWRFRPDGACTHVPGLSGAPGKAHGASAYPVREQQGFVWIWGDPEVAPEGEPFRFRLADDPTYTTVRRTVRAEGSMHMVAENALDVPHTAFVHAGLFRNDKPERTPITCVVEREADRVVCEYVGEARPEGLVGRLLSPSGGTVTHFDRFYLPSVVEVEYRIGTENHILVDAVLTPEDDYRTVLHAVVSVRTRVPGWLLKPVVLPFALWIFRQDALLLAKQTATMQAFGEQRYASTEIDLLGPHILKLMQRAAAGRLTERQTPWRKETTLLV